MEDLRGHLTDLLHSYAHYADRFDLDAFVGLFAEDVSIEMGGAAMTREDFRAMLVQNEIETAGLKPRHTLSNLMFTQLAEARAQGCLYFTYHQTIDSIPTLLISGTYEFELDKGAEGWRIQRWVVESDRP